MIPIRTLAALAGLALAAAVQAQAPTQLQAAPPSQARVIVSFKAGAAALREHPMSRGQGADVVATLAQRRADALTRLAGVALRSGRMVGERAQVVSAAGVDAATLVRRLSAHPDVAHVMIDRRRRALYAPDDPLFLTGAAGRGPAVGQWYLRAPTDTVVSPINAQGAWDLVRGSASVVVAVLDTGVLASHVDLAGAVLPGYDMIADLPAANDGNGRDADASDPGDWITSFEDSSAGGPFYQCGAQDSSWHGTQMAGLIGAIADNGIGMAGAAAGVRILPVRVLGKCGGYDADILAGMYWAAGIDQPGLPGSTTPARVINMSLGGDGPCEPAYLEAVQAITARNAIVVAAAGNSAGRATGTPANCPGVVAVAGLRHAGSKVGFSDLGPEITISAPGGNCVNLGVGEPCLYSIITTRNSGTRAPNAGGATWSDAYAYAVGTSFSAPLVAATAALMISARTQLTPAEIVSTLKSSARPFPTSGANNGDDPTAVPMCRPPDGADQLQCYCTTEVCGAGMLDTGAAVLAVIHGAPVAEVARQLMDFGEQQFAHFFPGRPETQSTGPFLYRYYASAGTYLGVAVRSDYWHVLGGVYVMGGPFGTAPLYVGRVTDFITPTASPLAAGRSR